MDNSTSGSHHPDRSSSHKSHSPANHGSILSDPNDHKRSNTRSSSPSPPSNRNATLPTYLSASGQLLHSGSKLDRMTSNPALPVLCYCAASILMTVVNKVHLHFHSPSILTIHDDFLKKN